MTLIKHDLKTLDPLDYKADFLTLIDQLEAGDASLLITRFERRSDRSIYFIESQEIDEEGDPLPGVARGYAAYSRSRSGFEFIGFRDPNNESETEAFISAVMVAAEDEIRNDIKEQLAWDLENQGVGELAGVDGDQFLGTAYLRETGVLKYRKINGKIKTYDATVFAAASPTG